MLTATRLVGRLIREAVEVAESVDRAGARALHSLGMSLRLLRVKFGDIEDLPKGEMKRLRSEITLTKFKRMMLSWRGLKLAALRGDALRAALAAVQEVGRLHDHVCRGQPPMMVGRTPAFSAAHALSMLCEWLLGRAGDAIAANDDLARAWISRAEILHEQEVASNLLVRLVNEVDLVCDLPKKEVRRLLGKTEKPGGVPTIDDNAWRVLDRLARNHPHSVRAEELNKLRGLSDPKTRLNATKRLGNLVESRLRGTWLATQDGVARWKKGRFGQ